MPAENTLEATRFLGYNLCEGTEGDSFSISLSAILHSTQKFYSPPYISIHHLGAHLAAFWYVFPLIEF